MKPVFPSAYCALLPEPAQVPALVPAFALTLALCSCGPSETGWIHGIDISHHQAPLDWDRIKAQGARFAYIKATEGADWDDPAYRGHEAAARAAGVTVGAYHFFTFCADPAKQATHFLTRLHLRPGDLPPAVDVEAGGNCAAGTDPEALARGLEIFNSRIENALGRVPVLYTTQAFFWTHLRGSSRGAPLWIRNVATPPLAAGAWTFWQHRVGRLAGAEGTVDQNVFPGDETAFRTFLYRSESHATDQGQSGRMAAIGLSLP